MLIKHEFRIDAGLLFSAGGYLDVVKSSHAETFGIRLQEQFGFKIDEERSVDLKNFDPSDSGVRSKQPDVFFKMELMIVTRETWQQFVEEVGKILNDKSATSISAMKYHLVNAINDLQKNK